ncbi:hypothetical protein PR048_019087 [Dryococelus australis]|uniref:Uncharacterized protein n=1 Tax=Dryococelus australis TaxID=614101 RepID=A0ABQ9H2J3_9NEOP|nr:hypothetical protein PR048_019087 [Dryococelus australis]
MWSGSVMKGRGKTGDSRENPPTNGIVRHDSHLRKSVIGETCGCAETNRHRVRAHVYSVVSAWSREHPALQISRWGVGGGRGAGASCGEGDGRCLGVGVFLDALPFPPSILTPLRLPHHPFSPHPQPGHSRIFASGNRAWRCRWSAGFLEDLPFPPPLNSVAASHSPHFTLIGPILFTHSLTLLNSTVLHAGRSDSSVPQPAPISASLLSYISDENHMWILLQGSAPLVKERVATESDETSLSISLRFSKCEPDGHRVQFSIGSCFTSTVSVGWTRASEVKKRGSDTGDTNTHAERLIAPTRKACSVSAVTLGTVAEWLDRSPPTKANRAQSPAGSPDFRMWESCRTMPFPPPFHSGAAPYSSVLKTSLLRAVQISSLTLMQRIVGGRGDVVVRLLAHKHQTESGRSFSDFRLWESCRTMPLVGGFSWGSPVPPSHTHHTSPLIGSQDLNVKSLPNLSTRSLTHSTMAWLTSYSKWGRSDPVDIYSSGAAEAQWLEKPIRVPQKFRAREPNSGAAVAQWLEHPIGGPQLWLEHPEGGLSSSVGREPNREAAETQWVEKPIVGPQLASSFGLCPPVAAKRCHVSAGEKERGGFFFIAGAVAAVLGWSTANMPPSHFWQQCYKKCLRDEVPNVFPLTYPVYSPADQSNSSLHTSSPTHSRRSLQSVPRRSGITQLSLKVARDARLLALNNSPIRGSHVELSTSFHTKEIPAHKNNSRVGSLSVTDTQPPSYRSLVDSKQFFDLLLPLSYNTCPSLRLAREGCEAANIVSSEAHRGLDSLAGPIEKVPRTPSRAERGDNRNIFSTITSDIQSAQ